MAIPKKNNVLKGGILRPSASISAEYSRGIQKLIIGLKADIERQLKSELRGTEYAMDASPVVGARMAFNRLADKWNPLFSKWAKRLTDKMIKQTLKNADVTFGMSLKDMTEDVTIKMNMLDEELMLIIKASYEEANSLIKQIPDMYIGQVQGGVMRGITQGLGLKQIMPLMNRLYKSNARKAELTAQDQVRKTYSNITTHRMASIGMTKYEWVHSGGGMHPRKEHLALNGKIFDINDPPVIGVMYGQEVRGEPGLLPNCRCVKRVIVSFEN